MSAVLKMVVEAPRLYSRQQRAPADVIAIQHVGIHADLEAWGQYCRDRYESGTCASAEKFHDETGGRQVRAPQVALPENPRHRQVDKVVRHMRMQMPQHGEALRLFYAGEMQRRLMYVRASPHRICIVLHLRFEDFPGVMFYARAATINLLRRLAL